MAPKTRKALSEALPIQVFKISRLAPTGTLLFYSKDIRQKDFGTDKDGTQTATFQQ